MNLKQLREKANLTQEQASKITGFSIRFISQIETGERNPSDNSKEKLAKAYRVPIIDVFLASQRTKRSKRQKKKGEKSGN